jgi:putative DNA methylase
MAITNYERVGKALELPRDGLRPFVEREMASRLYTVCERKKRAAEALSYNGLVQSWPEITRLAREKGTTRPLQGELFGQDEQD